MVHGAPQIAVIPMPIAFEDQEFQTDFYVDVLQPARSLRAGIHVEIAHSIVVALRILVRPYLARRAMVWILGNAQELLAQLEEAVYSPRSKPPANRQKQNFSKIKA